MAWYPDLAPCGYFGRCASVLRAVGWLSASHPYVHGDLQSGQRQRLRDLIAHIWSPIHFLGVHPCEFCSGYACNGNLWVPAGDVVFVAPDAILHYVEEHQYRPPPQFLDAMMACPEMGSDAYLEGLAAAGGREFAVMVRLAEPDPVPEVRCPYCRGTLRTPSARQCRHCRMDWHDPDRPRRLGEL